MHGRASRLQPGRSTACKAWMACPALQVFKAKFRGQHVAVKVLRAQEGRGGVGASPGLTRLRQVGCDGKGRRCGSDCNDAMQALKTNGSA